MLVLSLHLKPCSSASRLTDTKGLKSSSVQTASSGGLMWPGWIIGLFKFSFLSWKWCHRENTDSVSWVYLSCDRVIMWYMFFVCLFSIVCPWAILRYLSHTAKLWGAVTYLHRTCSAVNMAGNMFYFTVVQLHHSLTPYRRVTRGTKGIIDLCVVSLLKTGVWSFRMWCVTVMVSLGLFLWVYFGHLGAVEKSAITFTDIITNKNKCLQFTLANSGLFAFWADAVTFLFFITFVSVTEM